MAAAALLAYGCGGAPSSAASISEAAPRLPTPLVAPPTAAPPTSTPAAALAQPTTPSYSYQVVRRYPHDTQAWTEGLVYVGDDTLYESTGEYAKSSLRKVRLSTGEVLDSTPLGDPVDPTLYGEGISPVGDTIFMLTWRNCLGLLFNRKTFEQTGQFAFPASNGTCDPKEGWGMTYDGSQLIMSDGTSTLSFIDPAATIQSGQLTITRQVQVTDAQGVPVRNLNELEYINGTVFANVWLTDRIVQIDPASGAVIGQLDLTGLLSPAEDAAADVLNGIAYDAAGDRLFVTGKYWPAIFEITLQPPISFHTNLPIVVRG
ncbi:glutaminyl-peptide cyclotransferase [Oscillochloris sp. ZM17-4]|nr:glutaminyl-peptide cyclotransferase [Oscillochloris sp. ZM17-4]